MTIEKANGQAVSAAAVGTAAAMSESADAQGIYHAVCRGYKPEHKDRYLQNYPRLLELRAKRDSMLRFMPTFAQGLVTKFLKELEDFEAFMHSLTEEKWDSYAHNTVVTVGKNAMLDNGPLGASAYTKTGPFMGLIGAVSYTAISAADTMASHAGWTEAGTTNAPTYTGPRKTISFNAASAGSTGPSSAPVYTMTGAGTVKGVFIVCHTGALSTIDNTAGTLWSAGLFTGGDQAVVNTNTVTVTYSTSL